MCHSFPRAWGLSACFAFWLTAAVQPGLAQVSSLASPNQREREPVRIEDSWIIAQDVEAGLQVHTRELTLHPRAEPKPALKHRLIPDAFHRLDGNAAIYYLKTLGFLEQDPARDRLREFQHQAVEKARDERKETGEVAPFVWLTTPPSQLPLAEVNDYLSLTSFQIPLVQEAARRNRFDLDRNLRDVEDPIAYLLPEIQAMRDLARKQSLRFRVAIAEERVDDAIELLGQQLAMARHLGQDEFLISNLVGIAIASIAWNDAMYLIEHPEAPNLYWALASLPAPLLDLRQSMATERQLLYLQVKALREVDETPRPAGYWRDFIDRMLPQLGYLASEMNLPSWEENPDLARAALVGYIAAAFPGAKACLIEQHGMTEERLEAYPTAQVVFLAMVKSYNYWRDEVFKWHYPPLWQARTASRREDFSESLEAASDRYGFCLLPVNVLLPAVQSAGVAEVRNQQRLALLQTIEAIRWYGASHDGAFPPSLQILPAPAPVDPFTGELFQYERMDGRAILTGHAMSGVRYRLVLRFAPNNH